MKQKNRMETPMVLYGQQRRSLNAVLAGIAISVTGCVSLSRPEDLSHLSEEDKALRHKFRGIYGGVLRVDAMGYPKQFVSITNDRGRRVDGSSLLTYRSVKSSTFTGGSTIVPKTIRATWKTGPVVHDGDGWIGGTIIGDYTVPVASRISDDVLDYIRANGGALRLKIRLHDSGILIGWDVEMRLPIKNLPKDYSGAKNYLEYHMAGGDFQEAKIYNGKVVRQGWYLDKEGKKVMTEH